MCAAASYDGRATVMSLIKNVSGVITPVNSLLFRNHFLPHKQHLLQSSQRKVVHDWRFRRSDAFLGLIVKKQNKVASLWRSSYMCGKGQSEWRYVGLWTGRRLAFRFGGEGQVASQIGSAHYWRKWDEAFKMIYLGYCVHCWVLDRVLGKIFDK